MCSVSLTSCRAFLAIPLPQQLQESISSIQRQLQTQIPDARWVRPKNLHMTLHFFGEIEQEVLEKIKVSVLSVKGCRRPFMVEVKGLGAFPNLHRPRIVWLDLDPKAQLRQLHQELSKTLHQAGVITETRPYSPHLTIGRLGRPQPDLTALFSSVSHSQIGQLSVDKLVLFESRLQPGGAEHLPLLTVNLDENDNP
jgi:2'-5' RNA ligase